MTTTEQHGTAQITTTFSVPVGFPLPENLTFKERKQLAVAIGKFQRPSSPLENYFGRVLQVQGFIQHPASVTSIETGEVRDVTRTVFLLEGGDCVSSTSEAVNRFCQQLIGLFGPPDLGQYEEAFAVSVLPQKTKGGKTTYALSIVE